jgi:hypothetical protein
MINKEVFKDLPIDLKGDFVFQKGTFIDSRVYGFLKMVLYKTDSFFVEVVYQIENNKIEDVIYISDSEVKSIYKSDFNKD